MFIRHRLVGPKKFLPLWIGALHAQEDVALSAALGWLQRYDLNQITYQQHHVLARIGYRFPTQISDLSVAPRIQGLQKMLTLRGKTNIHAIQPYVERLELLEIPNVLTGSSVRFLDDTHPWTHECDVVELVVSAEAYSLAQQQIVLMGWQKDWSSNPRSKGLTFATFSKGKTARTRILTAESLLKNLHTPPTEAELFGNLKTLSTENGRFSIPSIPHQNAIAVSRLGRFMAHPENGVWDVAGLKRVGAFDLSKTEAPHRRRVLKLLEKWFGQ